MLSKAVQTRLDKNPQAMRARRETVEHPFATLKMRMGATHFLMKRLNNVATEMALNVPGYNLTHVIKLSASSLYWPRCGREARVLLCAPLNYRGAPEPPS